MLQDQTLWIMLVELDFWEPEFELAQPLLFSLSDILYQIKPYMETIEYESPFLFFE
jgi:hypothetical protein